jgi:hypothetical protein
MMTAAFALTAACAATPSGIPAGSPSGVCNAANAQFALGRTLTPELENEARLRSGASVVRVIRPGQIITKDYSEQRLNIEIDAGERVVRVRCG